MESGGGSGILIHAQQGDSHERTKSYERTLSPGIMKGGGDTLKFSHKSFTGSSQGEWMSDSSEWAYNLSVWQQVKDSEEQKLVNQRCYDCEITQQTH